MLHFDIKHMGEEGEKIFIIASLSSFGERMREHSMKKPPDRRCPRVAWKITGQGIADKKKNSHKFDRTAEFQSGGMNTSTFNVRSRFALPVSRIKYHTRSRTNRDRKDKEEYLLGRYPSPDFKHRNPSPYSLQDVRP